MRLFVGFPVPPSLARTLEDGCRRMAPRLTSPISWVRADRMHITLKFLGEVPDSRVGAIAQTLGHIHGPAFVLAPQRAGFFPNPRFPRVLWIGFAPSPEAQSIFQAVEDHLAPLGFPREPRAFTPHLTLARIKTAHPQDPWSSLEQGLSAHGHDPFPVERMVLWHSILTPQGPRYHSLHEFPLGEFPSQCAAE